ncbi:50S ribosomal protein L10 [Cuniculiplasma divulgatum]|jgi:large subunit ribosomal protein L10|uniref:Large ribosomal subunit protein uL10 n=1 Tax=Cuniculiplasma divulgatum TaxID=1673428 RepID=A0A1N5SI66_9ARCH|nr:50S ribosomal protein L10 [Cuniculiplasma divulgatum]EQB69259.1 MAG: acidic ribosomal protein P0 [Thermoplasmatales archaeon Gpl]MCI2412277.1 50S ribosomal protein L10 [Cuniculiplasma sp.]MCL4320387.1 50S ribosomal protein L10 [Candidatus Thermoplasmatota archaeon]OWP55009.1 MAG: 50S ribosomal protein L10 [Cuniculiplasma sp. C_DKE]WMT50323.1 MAG: 50S ribosomal protein L10 [Thermoplasmatales archaeon]
MTVTPQWKVDLVDHIASTISESPVTAFVSIKGIRNKQLQGIRRALKGEATIRVVRGTLLEKALEKAGKKNIEKLKEFVGGQIALVTTLDSPAKLYSKLEKNRQKSAARGGEIAEEDIVVPAKDTNFPPGPMISEFQKVGLQAAIEKGKIVIKKEMLFVKKGDKISKEKAKILEKLEILPLDVGLDVVSAYEDGIIFDREAMSLTPEKVMADIASAFSQGKVLATDITFIVKEIMPELIVKARIQAESLAMEANFVDENNMASFILKAVSQASALQNELEGEPEETKEATKEEKPKEEDGAAGFGALFG